MRRRTKEADVGAKVNTSGGTALVMPVLGLALKLPSEVGAAERGVVVGQQLEAADVGDDIAPPVSTGRRTRR